MAARMDQVRGNQPQGAAFTSVAKDWEALGPLVNAVLARRGPESLADAAPGAGAASGAAEPWQQRYRDILGSLRTPGTGTRMRGL